MNSNISIALDIVNDVIQTTKGTICFSRGHLQESIASGFGHKSWASFRASAKEEGLSSRVVPARLSPEMARSRMRVLCPKDADALHSILSGVSLSLEFVKRPRQQGFPGRKIYDIRASVQNHSLLATAFEKFIISEDQGNLWLKQGARLGSAVLRALPLMYEDGEVDAERFGSILRLDRLKEIANNKNIPATVRLEIQDHLLSVQSMPEDFHSIVAAIASDGLSKYAEAWGTEIQRWRHDELSTFALPIFDSAREGLHGDIDILSDRYIATSSKFYKGARSVRYWLDSNSHYRAGGREFDRYLAPEISTRLARLRNGEWQGALFINEDVDQRESDDQIVQIVKGALARTILAAASPGVRCLIYAPENYDFGAWHVLMTLGIRATQGPWGESSAGISFNLPDLERRIFRLEQPFLWPYPSDVSSKSKMPFGGKFEKGVFHAHLYTNGVPEERNTTRLTKVRDKLIDEAELALGI